MKRVLLGMLTPSSNTVLEPVTTAMLDGLPEVTAHFGRFRVTEISLGREALGQFELDPVLRAAELLADAKVDVIAWNGTSAGWRGFEVDALLCERITAATGIKATTSILALNEVFARTGVTRFGLASPYIPEIQDAIISNYRKSGLECVAECHLNERVNFNFSNFTDDDIAGMLREIAAAGPQAITTYCTNMRAAPLVDALERELGVPIYDTISVVVWKSLIIAGVDPARVKGWGRLFAL